VSHLQGFGKRPMYGSFCAFIKACIYVLKKSYSIFPLPKGSMNARKLAGFSIFNNVKKHWIRLNSYFSILDTQHPLHLPQRNRCDHKNQFALPVFAYICTPGLIISAASKTSSLKNKQYHLTRDLYGRGHQPFWNCEPFLVYR